jgi:excisionase family DNA binding protein
MPVGNQKREEGNVKNAKANATRMDLLNVDEAASYLRLSTNCIRSWVHKGRVPFIKLGRRVVFRRSDLDNLVLAGSRPATKTARTQAA